jgi:phenylalanyl-tRNA synthetase alpha chain
VPFSSFLTFDRSDVVKDDPTNNVPDSIFAKLGMQLHRRDNHPLGILKKTIYDYFDKNFAGKFEKFDDLCPIVTVKQVEIWLLLK